mmetsp:Transcript_3203/g.10399  ORF Transcript_3203/g.10399 Transcript_3203/m.10399 type:complete len:158 (-) Transcript_3203:422-895(-)
MAWALESLGQPPTWLLVLATPVALLFGYRWLQRRLAAMDEASARAEAAALSTKLQKNPKTFTKDELLAYNGMDRRKPLLLALKGRVIDVSAGADFYGPGGPYGIFAGKDASKGFAMMSLKEEDAHSDLTGVDDDHLRILDDWYSKLTGKYPTVGHVA